MRRIFSGLLVLNCFAFLPSAAAMDVDNALCLIFSHAVALRRPKPMLGSPDYFEEALDNRWSEGVIRKAFKTPSVATPNKWDALVESSLEKTAALGVKASKQTGKDGLYMRYEEDGSHPVNQLARELKQLLGTELWYDPNGLDTTLDTEFVPRRNAIRVSDEFVRNPQLDLQTVQQIVHAAVQNKSLRGEDGPFNFSQTGFADDPKDNSVARGSEMAANAVAAHLLLKGFTGKYSAESLKTKMEVKEVVKQGVSNAIQSIESQAWVGDWLDMHGADAFTLRKVETVENGNPRSIYFFDLIAKSKTEKRAYRLAVPEKMFSEWGIPIPATGTKVRALPPATKKKIQQYFNGRIEESGNRARDMALLFKRLGELVRATPPDLAAINQASLELYRSAGYHEI